MVNPLSCAHSHRSSFPTPDEKELWIAAKVAAFAIAAFVSIAGFAAFGFLGGIIITAMTTIELHYLFNNSVSHQKKPTSPPLSSGTELSRSAEKTALLRPEDAALSAAQSLVVNCYPYGQNASSFRPFRVLATLLPPKNPSCLSVGTQAG